MKALSVTLFLLFLNMLIFGQGIERPRKVNYLKPVGEIKGIEQTKANEDYLGGGYEAFQQIALKFENTTPKVNIKALKLYAQVGEKKYLDFYILTSVPTWGANPVDSAKYLGNELQNLYGGLLNSYFSHSWYLNKNSDFELRGIQIDIKGGYKLCETTKTSGTKNIYLHSWQLATEIRYLIPLKNDISSDQLAGLAQLKFNGQAVFSGSDDYINYFTNKNQERPSRVMFSGNIEASVHVYNEFYLSGGYSFNSIDAIENYGYFTVSYSRK